MSILAEKIREILRSEDIEGFIAMGAPDDEYSHEANELATVIESESISEAVAYNAIVDVWKKYFGPFTDEEIGKRASALKAVVKKIFS